MSSKIRNNQIFCYFLVLFFLSVFLPTLTLQSPSSRLELVKNFPMQNLSLKTPTNDSIVPDDLPSVNLSEVFVEVEISGQIPNDTMIWVGRRPVNPLYSNKSKLPDFSLYDEVEILNNSIIELE